MDYAEKKTIMDGLQPGDLVRVVSGDSSVTARVSFVQDMPVIADLLGSGEVPVHRLIQRGYNIELVERAEHALPVRPGIYATTEGETYIQLYLSAVADEIEDGIWMIAGGRTYKFKDLPYEYLPLRLVELAPKK